MNRTEDSLYRGSSPKESSEKGTSPKGKLYFSIDVKGGDIYRMHGEKG
jgi:hypothetical protein